jgi:DNA replication initiation complex subunit (GINS family)
MDFDELRKAQAKERAGAALQQLSEDFYTSAEKLLSETRKRGDFQSLKEYENALKILSDVYHRREQKLLLEALRDAREGSREKPHLTGAELELYDALLAAISAGRKKFGFVMRDGTEQRQEKAKVRVLVDLPRIIGSDMQPYGPFKTGETATLPRGEAEILVKRKAAETIGE